MGLYQLWDSLQCRVQDILRQPVITAHKTDQSSRPYRPHPARLPPILSRSSFDPFPVETVTSRALLSPERVANHSFQTFVRI